jgi:5-formyltetrahydrofolate cyclo-ligase
MYEKMICMDKNNLREMFLHERGSIPKAEISVKNEAITGLILSSSFYVDADKIFCFISVPGEPDTSVIIRDALSRGKKVYVPRTKPERIMEAVPIDDVIYENASADWPLVYGIPEPPSSLGHIDDEEFDLALVPSIAIDIHGFRLGHGGGYYDAFISKSVKARKRPVFIAIQFSEFFVNEALPREAHDMKVDIIATEKGLFTFVCE